MNREKNEFFPYSVSRRSMSEISKGKYNFLYLSSFMDKYFSGNVFKFLIFFNLLNLAGSLARS